MVTLNSSTQYTVNPLDHGFVPGQGLSSPIAQSNRLILQGLLANYTCIRFPSGLFEWEGRVQATGLTDVTICGDGPSTRIYQALDDGTNVVMLELVSCSNVTIKDLQLEGSERNGAVNEESSTIACVKLIECTKFSIVDNFIMGFAGFAIDIRGCGQGHINRNKLWGNQGVPEAGGTNSARAKDINLDVNASVHCRQITITENQCLSNNHQGIICNSISYDVVITDNTVVAFQGVDLTNEANTFATCDRKEGITVHYQTDGFMADSDQQNNTVTGNIVRNTRWSGIYCNSNTAANNNPGGIRGTISSNVISNTCIDNNSSQDAGNNLRHGITVSQFRQVTVNNNIVKNVHRTDEPNAPNAGIYVSATSDDTDGFYAHAIIQGNHIQEVDGYGIKVRGEVSTILIDANIVQDTVTSALSISNGMAEESGQQGDVIISNNLFESAVLEDDSTRGANAFTRITATAGEVKFSNNKLRVTNGVWGQTQTQALLCQISTTEKLDFRSNQMHVTTDGPGTKGNRRGLRLIDLVTGQMQKGIQVTGNRFENLGTALWAGSGSGTDMEVLEHDNRFVNCNTETFATPPCLIYSGMNMWRENTFIYHSERTAPDDPSVGPGGVNWLEDDRAINARYKPGRPDGWYYDGTEWKGTGGDYLNSMQFNVPRDGVTNATPALQAMVDYGVANGFAGMRVLPGKYKIDAPGIVLPTGNLSIEQRRFIIEGTGAILQVGAGVTAFFRDNGGDWGSGTGGNWMAYKPQINGFCFRGDDTSANGIILHKVNGAQVVGNDFETMDKAVEVMGSQYCMIMNNVALNCENAFRVVNSDLVDPSEEVASNVTYLIGNRSQCNDSTFRHFYIQKSATVKLLNNTSEGGACVNGIEIDNDAGNTGRKARRHVSIENHWFECQPDGPLISFLGATTCVEINGIHISRDADAPQNGIVHVLDNSIENMIVISCTEDISDSTMPTPPSAWFSNQAGAPTPSFAGRNCWFFNDNLCDGIHAGGLSNSQYWQYGFAPSNIKERTYDSNAGTIIEV